jgi:hypothetical protein
VKRANFILNRLFLFAFALSLISAHAHAALYRDGSRCLELLLNRPAEEQFLLNFKNGLKEIQQTESLAHEGKGGVYKIVDQDDRVYVVRFNDQIKHNIQFENFASHIVLNSPTVLTPFAKKLAYTEELQDILNPALSKYPDFYPSSQISVAAFVPLKTGFQYLKSNFGLAFQEKLLELRKELPANQLSKLTIIRKFLSTDQNPLDAEMEFWHKQTLLSRVAVAKNLKELYPKILKRFDPSKDPDTLFMEFKKAFGNMSKKEAAPLDNLELLTYAQLPESLRTQLSDMWALDIVLGIHDLHGENWLVDSSDRNNIRVVRIDLAFSTPQFKKGISHLKWEKQSPLFYGDISSALLEKLMANISPAMREYLRSLDPHEIKARANYVTFQITDKEIDGMYRRAKILLGEE